MYPNAKTTEFPSVITIFSAPNYLGIYNNTAAVICFKNEISDISASTMTINQYNSAPNEKGNIVRHNGIKAGLISLVYTFDEAVKANLSKLKRPELQNQTFEPISSRRSVEDWSSGGDDISGWLIDEFWLSGLRMFVNV
jgi:hypothetical protein